MLAIKNKNTEILTELLEFEADVNIADKDGNTPLIYAIKNNISYKIIELLLQNGADVDLEDKNRITPLLLAFRCERPEIIKILREYGADFESPKVRDEVAKRIATNIHNQKPSLSNNAYRGGKNPYIHTSGSWYSGVEPSEDN